MARLKIPYPMQKILKVGEWLDLTYTRVEDGVRYNTRAQVVALHADGVLLELPDGGHGRSGEGPGVPFTLGSSSGE